nr:hypothetical protein [Sphingobium sp.]
MHELFGGSGFARKGDAFLYQMDFGIQFVDRHPVAQVAIEAVGLFDEDRLHRAVLAQKADHLAEAGAAALLGGLDVHIFRSDGQSIGFGMVTQELELSRDGKTFPLLLARGNARIDHRLGRLQVQPRLPRPRLCRLRHIDTPELMSLADACRRFFEGQ